MRNVTSQIKVKHSLHVLLINVIVFLFIWLTVEFVYFFNNPLNKKSYRITCSYDWILYNYCPNAIDVKKNTDSDGGNFAFTYVNDIGQRIKSLSSTYPLHPPPLHVFIGDSFIQAEEMDFSETFYGRLSDSGYQVSAMGYSSWNVIQYREAIKKLAHEDTTYHVFLMPNDIIPAYYRSVYKERLENPARRIDTEDASLKQKVLRTYDNSLTKKVSDLATGKKTAVDTLEPISTNFFENRYALDCQPLSDLDGPQRNSLGFDYAVFSKHVSCWPQLHKEATDKVVVELELLFNDVKKLNSTLKIYMIPPGWSFHNQNTRGRQGNSHYFFGNMTRLTTEPLTMYLAEKLPNIDFISLEALMSRWMLECTNCSDLYYFSDDGHWTPEAHRRIADYLKHSLVLTH